MAGSRLAVGALSIVLGEAASGSCANLSPHWEQGQGCPNAFLPAYFELKYSEGRMTEKMCPHTRPCHRESVHRPCSDYLLWSLSVPSREAGAPSIFLHACLTSGLCWPLTVSLLSFSHAKTDRIAKNEDCRVSLASAGLARHSSHMRNFPHRMSVPQYKQIGRPCECWQPSGLTVWQPAGLLLDAAASSACTKASLARPSTDLLNFSVQNGCTARTSMPATKPNRSADHATVSFGGHTGSQYAGQLAFCLILLCAATAFLQASSPGVMSGYRHGSKGG